MTIPKLAIGTRRKSPLRSYALVLSAWMTGTVALISTPLSADVGNATPSTHQKKARSANVEDTLLRMLHDSGVLALLTNLPPMIIGESREYWQNCGSSDNELESWLNEAFAADEITRIAIDELQHALDTTTMTFILQWLDSPSGQTIIQAERSSASLSEDDFERYANELEASPDYRTERAPRIRALIDTTRTGHFVSVFNTELNAIISLSTACSPGSDRVRELLAAASVQRQDLSLVSVIMNINLHAPTAVIFRDVEDRVIDDYLEFSNSPAGKAYHDALIRVTRDTLIDRMEDVAFRLASR